MLLIQDLNDAHRGKITQHIIYQEIESIFTLERYKPMFWVRESSNTNSEVDMVLPFDKYLIPIEVKSGKSGRLRSLHQFIERTDHHYAVRFYAGSFSIESHTTPAGKQYKLMNLPYYLGTKIFDYLKCFVENHPM
jgi:predicted AAA+ superfamily ATPase